MNDLSNIVAAIDAAEVLSSDGSPVSADASVVSTRARTAPSERSEAPPAPSSTAPLDGPVPPEGRGREEAGFGPQGGAGGDLDLDCGLLPMTDLGNAKRFLARFGRDFLFVREWGWLAWDGRRWRRTGAEDRLEGAIKATVEAIDGEAARLVRSGANKPVRNKRGGEVVTAADELRDWAEKSQAAGHINCLAGLVQSYLARSTDDFDRDPMRINVANGTLVVERREGEPYIRLDPHRRDDLMTRMSDVVFDPSARCPLFDRFMDEVQPPADDGSKRAQRFLDQWGGLNLTGDATVQRLLFMLGKGRNGKSVWMDTVAHVAGDYGDTVPIETFLDQGRSRAAGAPTPELAMLNGVRCLRTSEPKKGANLDEALIKLATGGEPMKVRELNKGYFTLRVQFKLTIQGNYRPKIDGTDEGIWGRLMLILWPVFIPAERRDPKLTEKLKAEASGVLNRLLDGLCDWLDNGLIVPPEISEATETFRTDMDPLGRFLADCTRPTLGARSSAFETWQLFNAWGKAEGTTWSMKGLSNAMTDRGIAKKKASEMFWLDLELIKTPGDYGEYGDHSPGYG